MKIKNPIDRVRAPRARWPAKLGSATIRRSRVIFARETELDRSCELFIIYADHKLVASAMIARIETHIHSPEERTEIRSHWHCQNTRPSHPAQRNNPKCSSNSDRREQTGNNAMKKSAETRCTARRSSLEHRIRGILKSFTR